MAKALITGAGGFVGPYLARHLSASGFEVWGATLSADASDDYRATALDVRQAGNVKRLVSELQPDEIYHLAGITRPTLDVTAEFYDVNLYGTLNVLEAAREVNTKVLVVSSAYVYGKNSSPITETAPLVPVNHYGASKAAADLASISYALDGLHVIRVRPFNHSGPGQPREFVLPTIVHQLARIEAGLEPPILKLGNLDSVRDFSDVRDVVRAYPLLLEKGESGEVYNLARGQGVSIRELARQAISLSEAKVRLEIEHTRTRASDIPRLIGNPERALVLGAWQPKHSLENTLRDMLETERAKLVH